MWDVRQDSNYSRYMEAIGWNVDSIRGVYCYSKRLPMIGLSVTKIQRPQKRLTSLEINKLAKKNRSALIYIEPISTSDTQHYMNSGFKVTKSPMLPTKTILIDLRLSNQKLLKVMHTKTRYNIGLEMSKKHRYRVVSDVDEFASFWQTEAKRRGMFISLKKEIEALYGAFGKSAEIVVAHKGQDLLGGVLLVHSRKVSYYMYAFSTDLGKKEFAPTGLVWNALMRSKNRGSTTFDFEGIYDARAPLSGWKGFTRFKLGFGGKQKEYCLPLKKLMWPF